MGRTYKYNVDDDAAERRDFIAKLKSGSFSGPLSIQSVDVDDADPVGLLVAGRSDTSAIDAGDARNEREAHERREL